MTSNIGARFIQKRAAIGFQSPEAHETARNVAETVMAEVRRTFNPELLNRIDEIIVFEALTDDDLRAILRLLVEHLNANMKDRRIRVALLPEALDWLINVTCRDRSYGAPRAPAGHPAVHRGPALGGTHSRAVAGRGHRGVLTRGHPALPAGRNGRARPRAGLRRPKACRLD